jgi:hypothetical protein
MTSISTVNPPPVLIGASFRGAGGPKHADPPEIK